MVKGISRQVIVVQSPDPQLFEQAIFILKDEAVGKAGITDDLLLREANRIINTPKMKKNRLYMYACILWAACGAALTGLIWALSLL